MSADGKLLEFTIDTTGFTTPGDTWDLRLANVLPSISGGPYDTDFAGDPANITNGTIELVPEPSSVALLGAGVLLIGVRRRRKA